MRQRYELHQSLPCGYPSHSGDLSDQQESQLVNAQKFNQAQEIPFRLISFFLSDNLSFQAMEIDDWNYNLPKNLIAQKPIEDRSASGLLIYDRASGNITHRHFRDVVEHLDQGDCLILNSSRVIAARLFGHKAVTGGKVEVFLLRYMGNNLFTVLLKPKRKVRDDITIEFESGLKGKLVERSEDLGEDIFELTPAAGNNLFDSIEQAGTVPLPPYVKQELKDVGRYQTVYADRPGSVAAPTAGLHFTDELLSEICDKGVHIAKVDLKVSWGTFSKVTESQMEAGKLHPEELEISRESARTIKNSIANGGTLVACGTTSVRALEGCVSLFDGLREMKGTVDIFIRPDHKFRVVDSMITNFHLPGTSLLMLVAALIGKDELFRCYEEAIREGYRFYSFGDAMMII